MALQGAHHPSPCRLCMQRLGLRGHWDHLVQVEEHAFAPFCGRLPSLSFTAPRAKVLGMGEAIRANVAANLTSLDLSVSTGGLLSTLWRLHELAALGSARTNLSLG